MKMIRWLIPILFMLLCSAHAEIYRSVDEEGNITLSSQPPPGSKGSPVKLSPINTVDGSNSSNSTNRTDSSAANEDEESNPNYNSIDINQPEDGATIRNNSGNVTITLALKPALQTSHTVHLMVDGDEIASGAFTTFQLNNVDRGTHEVSAEVKDADGETLIKTDSISFSLLRAHVN